MKKGQAASLPCVSVGGKDGFTTSEAPCDGIKIKTDDTEAFGNCIFVSNKQLEESGFVMANFSSARVEKLTVLFSRKELIDIVKRLGFPAKGTKEKLAKIILSAF